MFIEERHSAIEATIKSEGKISVAEIREKYGVSDESARRDLRILEQRGLCKRTYGGAISVQQVSVRPPEDRDFSTMPVFENYRLIAIEAAKMIKENDIVYLTGGSFGHIIIPYLPKNFRYTIVANNVEMGQELRAFENIDVYIAGGKMRRSGSLTDSLAAAFVSNLHFDICFLTGAGLTAEFGLSNGTDETAAFQRAVIKNSIKKVLLLPGNKIGRNSFVKVCDVETIGDVITDWEAGEDELVALEKRGLHVNVVQSDEQGRQA